MSIRKDLLNVRNWAKGKINGGQEPPWAWYQYMKLIETTEAILASLDAVKTESSQQSDKHQEKPLRLVGATYQLDDAPHHPVDDSPQMPM